MTDYTAPRKGTELLALSHAERTFLWCIRVWSASHRDPAVLWPCLVQVFERNGMPCALEPFHGFMKAVFAGLVEPPDIRCLHAASLGEHEARLLRTLAHLQSKEAAAARQTVKGWLHPSSIRAVVFHGSACVVGARFANIYFAPCSDSRGKSPLPSARAIALH